MTNSVAKEDLRPQPQVPPLRRRCPVCERAMAADAEHCSRLCSIRADLALEADDAAELAAGLTDPRTRNEWAGRALGIRRALTRLKELDLQEVGHA